MKNNLEYYSHPADSHTDYRHKALRGKYKWEGPGKYYALCDIIAKSDDCFLDLGKDYTKPAIASDLDFTEDEFTEFIDFLVKLDLIIKDGDLITTKEIQDTYKKVSKDRSDARDRKNKKKSEPETEKPDNSTEQIKSSPELSKKGRKEVKEGKKEKDLAPDGASPDFIDEVIGVFCDQYKEIRGDEFISTKANGQRGKDRLGAGKLLRVYKERNKTATSDQMKLELQAFFRDCLLIEGKFWAEGINISKISSNLNGYREQVRKIRESRKGTGPPGAGNNGKQSEQNIQAAKDFIREQLADGPG